MHRRLVAQGVCLAVVVAGLATVPTQAAPTPGATPDPAQQLRDTAQGGIAVAEEKSTGKVNFVRASTAGDLLPSFDGTAAAKASSYVTEYAETFGAAQDQLKQSEVTTDQLGTTVSFVQEYKGLPVFGAELRAHVDKAGDLTSVSGVAVPVDASLSTSSAALRRHSGGQGGADGPGRPTGQRRVARRPHRHRGARTRADGLPHRVGAGHRWQGCPRLPRGGHQQGQRPRHRVRGRQHRQAGQPLLDDPRRTRADSHRGQSAARIRTPSRRSGARATPSLATSTPTSRTRSSARESPTGSSGTSSAETPTTVPGTR